MDDLAEQIAKADAQKIDGLLQAVLQRYGALLPDWAVSVVSLEKREDRNGPIDRGIAFLEILKSWP